MLREKRIRVKGRCLGKRYERIRVEERKGSVLKGRRMSKEEGQQGGRSEKRGEEAGAMFRRIIRRRKGCA